LSAFASIEALAADNFGSSIKLSEDEELLDDLKRFLKFKLLSEEEVEVEVVEEEEDSSEEGSIESMSF
jgi:hypothetical protein